MQPIHKSLATALVGLAVWSTAPANAQAQEFPNRPLRLIVPLSPGGVTEVMARLIVTEMAKPLGQQFIVENRTGGNGAIAGDALAKAPADGYMVGFFPNSMTVVLPLLDKARANLGEFKPVSHLYDLDLFVIARADQPASSLQQLIAAAKTQPGKLTYGTTGIGSTLHLGFELIKSQGGFDMTHVPYKGGADQITALLGGQITVAVVGTYDAGVWFKQGKVKLLASYNGKRNPVFPDVPTIAESGFPGFSATSWAALFVPQGTPNAATDRLAQAALVALRTPAVRDKLLSNGLTPLGEARPEQISAAMKAESDNWAKVIQKLGAQNLK